jgi:hypothetical protein
MNRETFPRNLSYGHFVMLVANITGGIPWISYMTEHLYVTLF